MPVIDATFTVFTFHFKTFDYSAMPLIIDPNFSTSDGPSGSGNCGCIAITPPFEHMHAELETADSLSAFPHWFQHQIQVCLLTTGSPLSVVLQASSNKHVDDISKVRDILGKDRMFEQHRTEFDTRFPFLSQKCPGNRLENMIFRPLL